MIFTADEMLLFTLGIAGSSKEGEAGIEKTAEAFF